MALSTSPINFLTLVDPPLFRVLLIGHLRLPLTHHVCSVVAVCWSPSATIRAACSKAGVLGRRGFALVSAVTSVCQEVGGRVTAHMMLCDMDLAALDIRDGRQDEKLWMNCL